MVSVAKGASRRCRDSASRRTRPDEPDFFWNKDHTPRGLLPSKSTRKCSETLFWIFWQCAQESRLRRRDSVNKCFHSSVITALSEFGNLVGKLFLGTRLSQKLRFSFTRCIPFLLSSSCCEISFQISSVLFTEITSRSRCLTLWFCLPPKLPALWVKIRRSGSGRNCRRNKKSRN